HVAPIAQQIFRLSRRQSRIGTGDTLTGDLIFSHCEAAPEMRAIANAVGYDVPFPDLQEESMRPECAQSASPL
ncbi:hypothetical protein SB861_69210, partial [Paraburkholderia sp. SIMBA_049]